MVRRSRKSYSWLKEHAAYGTAWLVIRMDVKYLYYRVDSGYPLEYWLGQNGQVRVQVGQPVGTNPDAITVRADKQGVVSFGEIVATGEGVSTTGRSQTIYNISSYAGAKLEDVTCLRSRRSGRTSACVEWHEGVWKPQTISGVAGSGGNIGFYNVESQVASNRVCQFSSVGTSGILQKVESDLDAWVVLYSSSQARLADAGRAYGVAASEGSGCWLNTR